MAVTIAPLHDPTEAIPFSGPGAPAETAGSSKTRLKRKPSCDSRKCSRKTTAQWHSFSDALRVETIECSEWLQPYGKTLRDATKFYLGHLKAVTGSRKIREVVADLLAAQVADGMSARYVGDLRVRLGRFVNCLGEAMIAAIKTRVKLTS